MASSTVATFTIHMHTWTAKAAQTPQIDPFGDLHCLLLPAIRSSRFFTSEMMRGIPPAPLLVLTAVSRHVKPPSNHSFLRSGGSCTSSCTRSVQTVVQACTLYKQSYKQLHKQLYKLAHAVVRTVAQAVVQAVVPGQYKQSYKLAQCTSSCTSSCTSCCTSCPPPGHWLPALPGHQFEN